MTLPLLSKERFCHRSNWMWLHYKRERMMPLPDSGEFGRLFYKLSLAEWVSPEQHWAKGLLLIRLRDCVVWQLWHWTEQNTLRASIRRMELAKTALCLDRAVLAVAKSFATRMFYAGQYDPFLRSFIPATAQMGCQTHKQTKKKPFKGLHHTWWNFIYYKILPPKVLYVPIGFRINVWKDKWMQFPECYLFHCSWKGSMKS